MIFNWLLICLGIFLLLYGLIRVTNVKVTWSDPLEGFAALIAGILCFVLRFWGG